MSGFWFYRLEGLSSYIFLISDCQNSPPQLFECGNTIQILVTEEMYYGLIFLHIKQCKTIHDELTTYLLPEQI